MALSESRLNNSTAWLSIRLGGCQSGCQDIPVERSLIAARLKGGRREAARKRGTYSGGIGVYGYRPVGSKSDPGKGVLKVIESEARAIRLAFKLRDAGKNLTQIAHRLSEEGYRTMRGAKFAPVHVHRILSRESFYRGAEVLNRIFTSDCSAQKPILENQTSPARIVSDGKRAVESVSKAVSRQG